MALNQTKNKMYNPTCFFTGEKSNLKMHPMRNDQGDMVGWIFVQNAIEMENVKLHHTSEVPESVQKAINLINSLKSITKPSTYEVQTEDVTF